jgi:hypothetical protein
LVPAFDGGDDFVGVGGPREGFGLLVVLLEEAVDCRLEVDDGVEDASFEATLRQFCEEASTALSHEHEVGVKWKVKR